MTLLIDDDGPVRTITLNRPEVRNAIDIPLRIALAEALEAAGGDSSVRAVVLAGAGRLFCSGGDISTMRQMPEAQAVERIQMVQRVIRAIWNAPKPVLAAVEGGAFGAGTALAAACDRVIAAGDARFAASFSHVGLAGDMGVYVSLPARIGLARTRQMLLMGQRIDAATALDWGLVDEICEPGGALRQATADARHVAELPAKALGVMKTMLALAPTLDRMDVLDREAAYQATLFETHDFVEGIAAFQEKRPPNFGDRAGAQP